MSTLLAYSNGDKEKEDFKENLFQLANEFEKLPKQSEPPETSSEGPRNSHPTPKHHTAGQKI